MNSDPARALPGRWGLHRAPALPAWRPALAGAALAGLLAAGLAIAAGAAAGPSFLVLFGREKLFADWLAGPLAGLAPGLSKADFSALVLAMCAGYATVLALARAIRPRLAIGAIVALHLIFLVAPPLLTTDPFFYITTARIGTVYDLNPYADGARSIPDDVVNPFIRHKDPSPYGPLFTVISYPLAAINFHAAMWLIKLGAALASLGCVALVWRGARLRGRDPVFSAMFVGLNPVLLVWAVGGGHNDLLLTLLVLVGVERILAGRDGSGGAALAGAFAVKAPSALILPFALLGARQGRRLLAATAGAGAGLLAAVTIVLGPDALLHYPSAVANQSGYVSRRSVPTYAGQLAGLGGATGGIRLIASVALLAVVVALLVRTWRGADWISSAGWATLALLVTLTWLVPWYIVWILPLAALALSHRLKLAALAMTAFMVITLLFD